MNKSKLPYIEGWLSIAANTLLFSLKYWAGIVSGSIAIIADAWHTLSDSISSVFVLIGAKVSEKPPDERHPFGHGRAELITAIIIGMFLAFIAYEFTRESIQRLSSREQGHFGAIAVIVTIVSIVIKEALSQFAFWTYRQTGSKSLRADAWHHRTDALSSVIILAGILVGRYFWWIDGLLGILVALMIFYSAFDIVRDAVDPLLGKKPDQKIIDEITPLCNEICEQQIQAHHFHIHEYGDHSELTFHIVFPEHCTLKVAHFFTNKIVEELRRRYNIEATIHMEPVGEEKEFYPERQETV